ncbi:MAG TPA: hypothetical protein VG106_09480, partial [Vicinamibacterales bacterium]|nr:hypothetical protein [Vicinamibacterales bacterium]
MKTTRREFLSAAAATPIVSPILLGMQDKSGSRRPILGEGAHTYEAIHDWGELPPAVEARLAQLFRWPHRRGGVLRIDDEEGAVIGAEEAGSVKRLER